MAALCDVYVNDAFGTAHRAEATTHGIARFAPIACAGPLMAAELDALGKALEQSRAPAGGDRRRLQGLDQAHHPEIARREGRSADRRRRHRQYVPAGGRACPSGNRSPSPTLMGEAQAIMDMMKARGAQVPLPADVVVASDLSAQARANRVAATEVRPDDMILDIGPQTRGAARGTDRESRAPSSGTVRSACSSSTSSPRGTQDHRARHRRVEGIFHRRRRRHARRHREIRHRRQDFLHLHRRRRVSRVPRRQEAAGGRDSRAAGWCIVRAPAAREASRYRTAARYARTEFPNPYRTPG